MGIVVEVEREVVVTEVGVVDVIVDVK